MRFEVRGVTLDATGGPLLVTKFVPGEAARRNVEADRPGGDGVIVGRDRLGGATWGFEVQALPDDGDELDSLVSQVAAAWAPVRTSLETVVLRYLIKDRWRRVYGRPGKFAQPDGYALHEQDAAGIEAEFRVTDPYHYDDALNSVTYSGVGVTVGGLIAPLKAPLSTRRVSGSTARFVTVGGDAPTPLAVRFNGPAVAPRLWSADGSIDVRLVGSLAYDEAVTIDARQQTIRRQDGASVPGRLSPRTRLASLVLPPGEHELFFSAGSEATVTVAWRNAWRSL